MRLSSEEIEALKKGPTKLWRFEEPTAEVGRKYSAAGEDYTVQDIRVLTRGAVLRKFGKSFYGEIASIWPEHVSEVWLISIVLGDWTDSTRFLAHSGFGDARGYTHRQRWTKSGLPTAMTDEPTVSDEDLARFGKAALPGIEAKQAKRQTHRKVRRALKSFRFIQDKKDA